MAQPEISFVLETSVQLVSRIFTVQQSFLDMKNFFEGPCPVAPMDRNILYENRLLGVPRYAWHFDICLNYFIFYNWMFRIRQLRVRNGSCEIHSQMVDLVTGTCYGEYHKDNIDKELFNQTIKEFVHSDPKA